jgi:hypothetical protein
MQYYRQGLCFSLRRLGLTFVNVKMSNLSEHSIQTQKVLLNEHMVNYIEIINMTKLYRIKKILDNAQQQNIYKFINQKADVQKTCKLYSIVLFQYLISTWFTY